MISRKYRAYHEAGHTIAHLCHGHVFEYACIDPREVYFHGDAYPRDMEVIALSGIAAEQHYNRRRHWMNCVGYDDMHKARGLIDEILTSGQDQDQIYEQITDEAWRIVARHWDKVVMIADALQEWDTLTYAYVLSLITR